MTVPAKRAPSGDQSALLRQMPSVDELLQLPTVAKLCSEIDRGFVVDITRQVLSQLRREIAAGEVSAEHTISPAALEARIVQAVQQELAPSLQPVINASGVILHTTWAARRCLRNCSTNCATPPRNTRISSTTWLPGRVASATFTQLDCFSASPVPNPPSS